MKKYSRKHEMTSVKHQKKFHPSYTKKRFNGAGRASESRDKAQKAFRVFPFSCFRNKFTSYGSVNEKKL